MPPSTFLHHKCVGKKFPVERSHFDVEARRVCIRNRIERGSITMKGATDSKDRRRQAKEDRQTIREASERVSRGSQSKELLQGKRNAG